MKNDVQNDSKKMHLFNNLKSSLPAVASIESVGVLGKNSQRAPETSVHHCYVMNNLTPTKTVQNLIFWKFRL